MLMKTLLLRGIRSGLVACATFLPTSTKLSYEAKFQAPVAGKVTVFQTNFGTSYVSHLMYSDGQRKHSIHAWNLLQGDETRDGSPEAQFRHSSTSCKNLNGERLYNDDSKENQIAVSTELLGLNGRTSFVVENRLITRATYLVIYSDDPNVPLACAPLSPIRVKTAAAKFNSPDVEGMILLSQETLYDPTTINVNLKLGSRAYSYGIDQLPKIVRRRSENKKCPNTRGVIYNPYAVDPENVPPQGRGTSDEYAVGDLSGKYGILLDKREENLRTVDYNLPLFGYFSVVGRAIVIYAPEGDPVGCANVELTGVDMRTAFATFDVPKQGQFIFRQPADDCTADTYIYIEVSQPASHSSLKTINHPWHVHVNPVDPGNFLSTDQCTAAGAHYNPFNVSTSCVYMRDCGPLTSLRCELGDTSSKLGTVDIPPYRPPSAAGSAAAAGSEPEVGKFFFTDINLPLCGPTAIVGKSVVIHEENYGMNRVACSNIIEYKPKREG